MTRSSRIINTGLGVVTQILGYGGAVVAVGFMTALGCWSEIKAAWERRNEVEPVPEDVPTRPHLTLVVFDREERTAENDQRWN